MAKSIELKKCLTPGCRSRIPEEHRYCLVCLARLRKQAIARGEVMRYTPLNGQYGPHQSASLPLAVERETKQGIVLRGDYSRAMRFRSVVQGVF